MAISLGITPSPRHSLSPNYNPTTKFRTNTTTVSTRPTPLSCQFTPKEKNHATSVSSVAGTRTSPFPRPLIFDSRTERLRDTSASAAVEIEEPEIIFVGTGTSDGVPRVSCLTNPMKICPVCLKAAEPGNKNRRRNTGLLIRYPKLSGGTCNILIDVGKFFYHSALTLFPSHGIRTIDAVIITHSHADAIGGLDDLRDWTLNVQTHVPIYVAERDFEVMKKTHYYLVDRSGIIPGAIVSDLQFNIINEDPFLVHDLKITPLPVWHGIGYRSLGFRFGNVCYISDVSEIPEETYHLLKDCDLLILDAVRPDCDTPTHFGLPRALEEVRKIRPKRTLFTGMMHLMDHEKINEGLMKLKESEGLDVQLSYDGLRVPITTAVQKKLNI